MSLDAADIEHIAARIVELLKEEATADRVRYVDATFVARRLGVDREWVYAHAHELGGVRLGGPRGRLRFDLQKLSQHIASPATQEPAKRAQALRRKRAAKVPASVDLLPYVELPSTRKIGGRAAQQRPRPDNGR